jgi:hypothetical protein
MGPPAGGAVAGACNVSGGVMIFVDQTAQYVDAFDPPGNGQRDHRRRWRGQRNVKIDATMGAARVVVLEIAGEDPL